MRDPFQQHLQPQKVQEVSLVAKDKIDLSGVKFVTRNHCKIFVLKGGIVRHTTTGRFSCVLRLGPGVRITEGSF